MLQNPCKTLGFKKNMVYEIPPGGGGKPYPASGLLHWYPSISVFRIKNCKQGSPFTTMVLYLWCTKELSH